jgi:hypothetical protein
MAEANEVVAPRLGLPVLPPTVRAGRWCRHYAAYMFVAVEVAV